MTEAGHRVIAFAFTELRLNRLVVAHAVVNEAPRKLIERLGLTEIGIEHEEFMKRRSMDRHEDL